MPEPRRRTAAEGDQQPRQEPLDESTGFD